MRSTTETSAFVVTITNGVIFKIWPSSEGTGEGGGAGNWSVVARHHTSRWARARGDSRVAAQHSDARAVLGAPERYHVLADVAANDLAVLCAAVRQDVLNEVVSKLVSSDCIDVSTNKMNPELKYSLSIKGMRGRSGRPSQMRSK